MGMLVDGKWRDEDPPTEIGKAGNFQRVESAFDAVSLRRIGIIRLFI